MQFARLSPIIHQRKREGFVRECHGDLHLGNIAVKDEHPLIFDGIEFNPTLRWIDTASELAFLIMDLDENGLETLGYYCLNRYLALSGDYDLLPLLRFYQVYRAMVRAKVTAIRVSQQGLVPPEQKQLERQLHTYLELAQSYTQRHTPALVLTHGLSGSGKSWFCAKQFNGQAAVIVRSDVERKRLAGLCAEQSSGSGLTGGIYKSEFSQQTYERLQNCAESIIKSGMMAVVDAAFLRQSQRQTFLNLAAKESIPVLILHFDIPEILLRSRIEQRLKRGRDASEADLSVLERQIEIVEPLTQSERLRTIRITELGGVGCNEIFQRLTVIK